MDLISTSPDPVDTTSRVANPRTSDPAADVEAADTGLADASDELRRLRRQVARERARRQAAESLGERATRDLYDSVRQLRSAQADLLENAERSRVVTELARGLRQNQDSDQLLRTAAESIGRSAGAERCDLFLLDAAPDTRAGGTWTRAESTLPAAVGFESYPAPLLALLHEAGAQRARLEIDDVLVDPRLDPGAADEVVDLLGARALAAVPIGIATRTAGWIVLHAAEPRSWSPRDLAVCEGISHDLMTTLAQVQAFEQQQESMRRLQELDQAKDAFISNVSHELRTPLTSIVGYLELMTDGGMGDLSEEQVAGLDIVGRNVHRLRALVEDLLTLSAYDGERGQREGRPVDLAAIVAECLQSMRPTIARSGLQVGLEIDPTLGDVTGDVMELERVMNNLLTNAVKFTRPGGQISVRLGQQRGMAVLVVADTGIGIPEAEQVNLFSRFFRSSLAVADEIQGTGLGLALVRGVVESYGGTIGVDSAEGEGTTVTVRLPLSR